MKKLLLLALLPLVFGKLQAQDVNKDVLILKESTASIKSQLKKQKSTQSLQFQKTDSEIASLKTTVASLQQTVNDLQAKNNEQQVLNSEYRERFDNISDAFVKRKTYAIAVIILSILLLLTIVALINKKIATIIKNSKQTEEELQNKISQLNEFCNIQIEETRAIIERGNDYVIHRVNDLNLKTDNQISEISSKISAQNSDIEIKISGLSSELQGGINKNSIELSNLIDAHQKTALSVSKNTQQIVDMKTLVEKEISAIEADLKKKVKELQESINNSSPKDKK